jgi:membrane fusion protein, copper/silver efflux system
MKTSLILLLALALAGCGKSPEAGRKIRLYQSPMHPWITSDQPGNCTICGMALVPVYEGETPTADGEKLITLHNGAQKVLGVATVPVRRLPLFRTLRFSGILEDDKNIHRVIAAFYDGRIETVFVRQVGQHVEKGQPLAAIYSPDLLYVVREFQNAMRGRNDAVARHAAQRLVQYGLSTEQVATLARQPDNVYTVDLLAPISGTILAKQAYQGQYIKTGEPLFEMGDLSRLWFYAEVYERDLPAIRIGQKAVLRTPSVPGREFAGEVTFIDPNFSAATRSTRVRVEVDNPASDDANSLPRVLPHRAYAEAAIQADLGEVLVVPRSAVLRDGRRSVVYVDVGDGRYEARAVTLGRTGDEGIEVVSGLAEGDRVVTSGNLLIDAEAQLRLGAARAETPAPSLPPLPEVDAFLNQLAAVSAALAAEDQVATVRESRVLPALADALPESVAGAAALRQLEPPGGSDLAALRRTFLPWSQAGAEIALAGQRGSTGADLRVMECPMTGDSFPGAPERARWVQRGTDVQNPYLGAAMLNCGAELQP